MSTMNISLPEALKAFVDEQVAGPGHGIRDLGHGQDLGSTGTIGDDGSHDGRNSDRAIKIPGGAGREPATTATGAGVCKLLQSRVCSCT